MTHPELPQGFVLQTRDMDEAASFLSNSAIPYTSELIPGSPEFSTTIFTTQGQRIHLTRVVTTGAMRVDAGLPSDAYAVVLDQRNGLGLHRSLKESVVVGPDFAFVQSPLERVTVVTPAAFEALFIRFADGVLKDELQKLLDRAIYSELIFAPGFRLQTAAGERLRRISSELRRLLYTTDAANVKSSPPLRSAEEELIGLLLQAQPHNYTRMLRRQSQASTWQVDAAEQFIRANAQISISLGDICQAAGVSARTLQISFRRRRGCTPMGFLRSIRLEQVRASLLQPQAETSVSGEASRWGFFHFGRFSQEYRRKYAELPSETLRRARRTQSLPEEKPA